MAEEMVTAQSSRASSIQGILLIVIAFILLIALGIYIFRPPAEPDAKRQVEVYMPEKVISVSDSLVYSDNTKDAKTWKWEFGNGDSSLVKSGKYKFNEPGRFDIKLTVDNELTHMERINVTAIRLEDTAIYINGPKKALAGQAIRFTANGAALRWEWSFGETAGVDEFGPDVFHTYAIPGNYTVKLRNGKNINPAILKLKIVSPNSDSTARETPEQALQRKINAIKVRLQSIANGGDFNTHYYDVLRAYLCNDENTFITVNEASKTDFYKYCQHLGFEKGIVIDELAIKEDPNGCVSQLIIKEHTKTD